MKTKTYVLRGDGNEIPQEKLFVWIADDSSGTQFKPRFFPRHYELQLMGSGLNILENIIEGISRHQQRQLSFIPAMQHH